MEAKYKVGDRFVNATNNIKVEILEIREDEGVREYGLLALDGNPKSYRNFNWESEAWLSRAIRHEIYLTT